MNDQNKQAAELTIIDLQNIRAILDVAARRGAFGGAELTSVGTVFNKLDTFLKSVEKSEAKTETNEASQPQG